MASDGSVKLIGRYAVCDAIGSGGMATIHIGRLLGPVGFSRTVAIKRMHPQLSADPEFVTMFLDEARVAARVQHANVVSTLDVVTAPGELLLVMEYVEGESFSRVLRTVGKKGVRLPLPIVGAIVSQALHGLHAVHEAKGEDQRPLGLIHRDVSPDNMLVGRDGMTRVLDFGIAKATEHGRRTQAGKIKGKVVYMAPEQMRGKDLDRRADLYAAASVLWEALTGERLVKGATEAEQIHHAVSLRAEPPSKIVPSLSREVDELVLKGLSVDPKQRFATGREMGIAVERVLGLASPATVAQLIEGMLGASLAKRAALVEHAMKATAELSSGEHAAVPSTPMPQSLRLDANNVLSDVRESPRGLIGPMSSEPPRAPANVPAAAARAAPAAGPFAPVQPKPIRQSTRPYGADLSFSELLASGGAPPSPAPPLASPQATPTSGTVVIPTLDVPGAPAPAAARLGIAQQDTLLSRGAQLVATPDLPELDLPGPQGPAPAVSQAAAPPPAARLPALELGGPHAAPIAVAPTPPQAPPSAPRAEFGGAFPPPPAGPGLGVHFGGAPAPTPPPTRAVPEPSSALAVDFGVKPTHAAPPASVMPAGAYRGGASAFAAEEPKPRIAWSVWLPVGLAVIVLLGVVAFLWSSASKPTAPAQPPALAAQPPGAAASCELLRKRVFEGGQPSGLSREGWVAELWLRGPKGAALDAGKIDLAAWRTDNPGGGAEVGSLKAPGRGFDEGLVVRMWGPAVATALEADGAQGLLKRADLAFESANAEAGALYLKCAHLPHHDFGLWFRGNELTLAASSVLFSMGAFAERAVIREGALDGPEHRPAATVFERVASKVSAGKTAGLDEEMERYGATVEKLDKGGVRIVFGGAQLPSASRLSRVIADRAGIENL